MSKELVGEGDYGAVYRCYDPSDIELNGLDTLSIEEELISHVEEGLRDGRLIFNYYGAYIIEEFFIHKIINIHKRLGLQHGQNLRIVIQESCAFDSGMGRMGISVTIYDKDIRVRHPSEGSLVMPVHRVSLIVKEEGYVGITEEAKLLSIKIAKSIKSEKGLMLPDIYYKVDHDSPSIAISGLLDV